MAYRLKGNLNGVAKRTWIDGPATLADAIAYWKATNPDLTDIEEVSDLPQAAPAARWEKPPGLVEEKK
jgi:hypothetical protein